MFNKLTKDIKNYVFYLSEQGYYISIHMYFNEYMLPLLDFNIHTNPYCLAIKSSNEEWDKCIAEHEEIKFSDNQQYIMHTCHAGLKEYIFKLSFGGSVCVSSDDKDIEPILIIPLIRMLEYWETLCPKTDIEVTENEVVNKSLKFINRNFYNNISNEDIAKFCNCSISSLCHLFKAYKGISIRNYLLNLRLQYSKKLLTTTKLSVTSIAHKSGFSDYNYFTSVFKNKTGVSPSLYRKQKPNVD